MTSKLRVTINDDGTLKLDARDMVGDEDDLVAELQELAREAGGELEVEKHVESHRHHLHGKHRHTHRH